MRAPREDTKPWFRQFWPWFLIALPASAVVASMITIGLAIKSRDGLVEEDYYRKGLAIYQDAARTQTARKLGVTANLHYPIDGTNVDVELNDALGSDPVSLILNASHPTRDGQDRHLIMHRIGPRRYTAELAPLSPANWRLSVEPADSTWHISGRIAVPGQSSTELR